MITLLALAAAFFLGSIPFGHLIGLSQGKDIRKEGSGNIGATNVWRTLGPKWGTISFLLDVVKGMVVPGAIQLTVLKSEWLAPADLAALAGIFGIAGHMLSPWMGFKGGKGIATGLGALLGTAPLVGICGFGVWIGVMSMCQYVSLSSVLAVPGVLAFAFFFKQTPLFIGLYTLLGSYVIIKHIPNLKRLQKGEEPKFSFAKKTAPPTEPKLTDTPPRS